MDPTDRQIVELLRENARMPTALLARRLGLSRSTVQFRLARLERSGVIAGFTVRLGEGAPRQAIVAHVSIVVHPKHGERVAAALKPMPGVRTLYAVSGVYDLIAILTTETPGEMDTLLDRIGQLPGIERTTSSIVLSTKFERRDER